LTGGLCNEPAEAEPPEAESRDGSGDAACDGSGDLAAESFDAAAESFDATVDPRGPPGLAPEGRLAPEGPVLGLRLG
jgi:hypothetical protein